MLTVANPIERIITHAHSYSVIRQGRLSETGMGEICSRLEHATGGQVTRHDLRPDIYPEEEK